MGPGQLQDSINYDCKKFCDTGPKKPRLKSLGKKLNLMSKGALVSAIYSSMLNLILALSRELNTQGNMTLGKVARDHSDKTRVQMPAKIFPHLKVKS